MAQSIDEYVGKRLFRRRRMLGLTQAALANAIGIRFQQIQKYECGANRMTAARLYELAVALNTPVSYFFEGLDTSAGADGPGPVLDDVFGQKETLELLRAYYTLSEQPRRRLLDLAEAMRHEKLHPVAAPVPEPVLAANGG